MENRQMQRRCWIASAASLAVGLLAGARFVQAEEDEGIVTANEDLMREHGIIRRVLLIYVDAARRARGDRASLPLGRLGDAAKLFREFAEDYHEHALEEVHIFPVVRKAKGQVAKLPDILVAQHRRGREITDYVRSVAGKPALGAAEAEPLAMALESFVHMYEPHAAREDTEVFPAWKETLGTSSYTAMDERFEEIEHKTFGRDGFDDALERIAHIEAVFGLSDLAAATAPEPPR